MKTELATAYSRTLEDRILAAEKAIAALHPGNIQHIAPMYLVKNEKAGLGPQPYDDTANVNGFDMIKINSMIRHLKTDKRKIIAKAGSETVDKLNWFFEVQVPANFSGRDAFVSYYYAYEGTSADQQKRYKEWVTLNENSILFESKGLFDSANAVVRLHYFILFSRSK